MYTYLINFNEKAVSNYRRWIGDIEDIQNTKVRLPLVSDIGCKVIARYGCARISTVTRELVTTSLGIFLIDIDKRIRSCWRYSPLTGMWIICHTSSVTDIFIV